MSDYLFLTHEKQYSNNACSNSCVNTVFPESSLEKNSTAANDEELHRDGLIRELMNSQRRTPVAAGGAVEKGANGKKRSSGYEVSVQIRN
jgi:hypothetical protein